MFTVVLKGLIYVGGPVPEGADAVVQIENSEQLPPAASGNKRVKINKVRASHFGGSW